MTTFNSTFDWDSSLPPSLASLDENDFLLMLQKEFPVGQPIAPSVLAKNDSDAGAPQALNKFQMPNTTSPLSTDSSPSPPSANDDNVSFNGSDGNNNNNAQSKQATPPTDDDHHKRKVSADDFDDEINGQPSAKSQHTDPKSKRAMQARRKSSGGLEKGQDETRLLKRKEQNRAAQRAFRERKEKHVKDLEDKVAQLEAKTESQATENENLRDMLSRLQNENVMLKQTAFTFSIPPTSNSAATGQSRGPSRSPSDPVNLFVNGSSSVAGPSRVPGSAGSSATTASSHDSPSSLFEGYERFSVPNSDARTASNSTSPPGVNASTSALDLDTMAFFGSPGPFTTISSNPMFTSYRDPVQSMNAFASFGGWDGDVNMPGPSSAANDNTNSGLEDLFGGQFSSLIPFNGDFLTGEGKDSQPGPPANHAATTVGQHRPGSPQDCKGACPKTKQDVERLIASGPRGTFGESPVVVPEPASVSPVLSRQNSRANEYESSYQHNKLMNKPHVPEPFCDNFNIDDLCLEMQRKAKCSMTGATCT